jgi:hypothetical protein
MANSYTWLQLSQAVSALQGRLANATFWSTAELTTYIQFALRTWNSLTEQWKQDFTFTAAGGSWNNLGTLSGSPRLRTVKDMNLYSLMCYMLLEPQLVSGAWAGTNQFNLSALQYALMRRRDEVIQAANCNLALLMGIVSTPGTRRFPFPDTTLEPQRIRFIPASGFGSPNTLTREDTQAFQYFEPGYLQSEGTPQSWSVSSEPPLSFDVDNAPNLPGTFDAVVLQSGPTFAPPAATLLGVPDDWSPLPMWGAMADLLSSEAERTDDQRAQYCLKMFTDGLEVMKNSNWLVQCNINGVTADTPSLFDTDTFVPEWQNSTTAWPKLVQAGMDFVAMAPTGSASVNVTLVGNIPVPVLATDYLQVSRDVWDVVLGFAQHWACFKCGGAEFMATMPLLQDFQRAAAETNKRILELGIFSDVLNTEGQRQEEAVPR